MQHFRFMSSVGAILGIALLALTRPVHSDEASAGATLYNVRCAGCHENATGRIPTRAALRETAPESIVGALTTGAMLFQASGMSRDEIRTVAAYLSAKPFGTPQQVQTRPNPCTTPAAPLQVTAQHWNGWGKDVRNTRYQPAPGLSAAEVPRLKMKWAYAYAGRFAQGQPTLIGDRLFVSNTNGEVSALYAQTGCERWTFKAATSVKVAVSVGAVTIGDKTTNAAFFGDERASVYAVNAETGEPLWKTTVDTHAVSRIVGAPVLHEGRLYVPVSAAEEGAAREPKYQCCTFRGSVVAMNAADGAVIWKTYGIVDEPKPTKINSLGVQMFGPAGAAIWSAPTIDVKRGLIYVGTGNSYTDTQADGSNAIVAFDLQTGARRWATQATAKDNFVLGCGAKQSGQGNCPAKVGPDFDFGAAPILHTLPGGRQIILAGQKSGMVYGLDPDSAGKVLWKTSVGKGSALGGIEWGPAVDASTLYVAVADANVKRGGMPGVTALNAADGKRRWYVKTPNIKCSWGEDKCRRGQPGAVTAMPGVVFSGALDGHIRAYDTRDGRIIWDADTSPAVATVNGPATEGGAIDAGGATLANGILYVNSGYGRWGKPGRLLIAYSVDGK